ncbi:MAG: nicotinamide-nucleotide amidohydrolase family protein [Caldimicrobium sp.]|nr:nicotinamide-nucleotide amidohydrolase family protein [Caldimicrobium sp.]MCX7873327.1 nicotinamide-nucleotide amidohydrolase family protein [Caldimicrobium sp.]MDW8093435.1 nicotinamide-nucleotide amidohydrolase family protein [Caldimicrobium sp.]
MRGAIIFIGDELIAGRILNTNAEFAGKLLSAVGLEPEEIITIPDREDIIIKTIKRLISEYDYIITSGGLGPTDDDVTTLALAKALNLPLVENKALLSAIRSTLEYKDTFEMAKRMALLPEGAEVLAENLKILGFRLNYQEKKLFFLPGVPSQFRELLEKRVLPQLCELKNKAFFQECKERGILKNLIFFDLNETELNQFLQEVSKGTNLRIGYYPVIPEVKLVLFGAKEEIERLMLLLRERFFLNLVGEESLPSVLGKLLTERGYSLSTAESCTGGMLASLITSVSGSSRYYERGFITYSADSKRELLRVKEETLREFGIYSHETAMEMAAGAKKLARSDFALSTTGIAGPTGGTSEIPVGTVFIALATHEGLYSLRFQFEGERDTIQKWVSYTALDILRRFILYGKSFFSYRFAQGYKERPL